MPKQPSIKAYVARRLLETIPLIFVIVFINFLLIHSAPGDPAVILAGEEATPEYVEIIRKNFGLDRPLQEQFAIYITGVFTGNLGSSHFYRQPVLTIIIERAPATLLLMSTQLLFASVIGVLLGVVAAKRPFSKLDNILSAGAIVGYCFPVFWLGIILLLVFSIYLNLFPTGSMMSFEVEMNLFNRIGDVVTHLILPALTLGIAHIALIFRLTRSRLIETLREDYIVTARVKGIKERNVLFKHALRNSLVPIVTVIGVSAGTMIAGAVMTETVFSWPGIGRLLYDSISRRDYPLIMGIFVVLAISVIFVSFIIDMICAFLDPRIRYR